MAGQDRVGETLKQVSPLINATPEPSGRGRWEQQQAIMGLMRDPDPITSRLAWEQGVQDGIVDPRLSPAAAASWWVDIQRGTPITEAPPEVQQELAAYRQTSSASPFAGYPNAAVNLTNRGREAARGNAPLPARRGIYESQNRMPGMSENTPPPNLNPLQGR